MTVYVIVLLLFSFCVSEMICVRLKWIVGLLALIALQAVSSQTLVNQQSKTVVILALSICTCIFIHRKRQTWRNIKSYEIKHSHYLLVLFYE